MKQFTIIHGYRYLFNIQKTYSQNIHFIQKHFNEKYPTGFRPNHKNNRLV